MSNITNNIKNKTVAYRRVSTESQNSDRQLYETGLTFDLEFEDKVSGKDTLNREGFQACIKALSKGDTLYIHDISRSGRNTEQVLGFIRILTARGVTVKFYKEGLEFCGEGSDPLKAAISQMVLTMLAAVHTLFITNNSTATKEGLVRAKARGVKLGAANPKWQAANKAKVDVIRKRTSNTAISHAEKYRTQVEMMISMKLPFDKMADKMKELKLTTQNGKNYTAGSMRSLCKYLGYDGKSVASRYEQFVGRDL